MLRVCVGFRFQLFINKIKKLKSTDNVAFVIQKRFRQIEIIRPRFLLMNHDLVLDFTRRTVQYIDTVREQNCFIDIMGDKKRGQVDMRHDVQVPFVDVGFCDSIQRGKWFVQQCDTIGRQTSSP